MKSNLRRFAALALLTLAFAGLTGCGFFNTLRAKIRLNDGVRSFNKGQYDKAQSLFEEALQFDPENVYAKFFYAMALNAQFEKAVNSTSVEKSETIEIGNKTIQAFQSVLSSEPEFRLKDNSIAFIANAYKTLKNQVYNAKDEPQKSQEAHDKYIEYITKRADMPDQDPKVKAQMYYTLGDDYWRAGREAILQFEKKDPANPQAPPTYGEISPEKVTTITQDLDKASGFMQTAIDTDPTYPEPYLGQKLIIMERMKLTSDQARRDELKQKQDSWDEQYRDKLAEQQEAEARKAEEDAKKAAEEGAGAGQ